MIISVLNVCPYSLEKFGESLFVRKIPHHLLGESF